MGSAGQFAMVDLGFSAVAFGTEDLVGEMEGPRECLCPAYKWSSPVPSHSEREIGLKRHCARVLARQKDEMCP